jgi:large subunit ribosomal protein L9
MKVILQQDVDNLGSVGDIVRVKDGYARNYLVPRGLVVIADERNVRRLQHQKSVAEARANKLLAAAREEASRYSEVAVTIKRQAGEEGKLFGSVTNRDVAEALAADGLETDHKKIEISEPIRSLGVFPVRIWIHKSVEAAIKVYVIQE